MQENEGIAESNGAPFVGRERELGELTSRLELARHGLGGVVLVAGEPGIGKTRLVQQVAAHAEAQGATVLWGRCWNPEMGAPAFWPWTEALASRVRTPDPAVLRAALATGAPELVQLIPSLRAALPDLPPHEPDEPEEARFRLFGAVTAFLRQLASLPSETMPARSGSSRLPTATVSPTVPPLLVVLDDLHWADKSSLLLLQYVARERGPTPFLVVGVYDDTALDPAHPLRSAVAALLRETTVTRLDLRGLAAREVRTLVEARVGPGRQTLVHALAPVLHQETEGNPFFTVELLDYLLQDARVLERHGYLAPAGPRGSGLTVPTSVRDVIEQRLARLADGTRRVLGVAAVIGRDFDAALLSAAMTIDADGLDDALGEAERAGVIIPAGRGDRFRFGHALVRAALYDSMPTRPRLRLHRRIAEVLESRLADEPGDLAGELAYHFGQVGDREKARRYSRLAGERAEAAIAWEEASRHYERCLALIERDGAHEGDEEAELLVAMGRCARNASDHRTAWRCLMRAIARYEEAGDGACVARAALEALRIPAPPDRRETLVRNALAVLGAGDPRLEAQLELHRSLWTRSDEERESSRRRAAELAERHGLADVATILEQAAGAQALLDGRPDEARRIFERLRESCIGLGRGGWALGFRVSAATIPLIAGNLNEGADGINRAVRQAGERHNRLRESGLLCWLAGIAHARGEHERCSVLLDRAGELHPASFSVDAFRALRHEIAGEPDHALARSPGPERTGGFPGWLAFVHGGRARIRFHAGDPDGARDDLHRWEEHRMPFRLTDGTPAYLHTLTCVDDVLPALGRDALVEEVYAELRQWSWARFGPANACGIDQLRGALALRLGRYDAAEDHYVRGQAWAERERCQVELGRCLMGRAEVARRRGRFDEALELLRRAGAIFQESGATLYLRRATTTSDEIERRWPSGPEVEPSPQAVHLNELSEREIEVLRLICNGRTNQQIAGLLGISPNTVARHVTHIFSKTGTSNRAAAVSYAHRTQLVSLRRD